MQVASREELIATLAGRKLPSLSVVEAEIAARAPVWHPQHRNTCQHYHKKLTERAWRADPCECPQPMAYWSLADITGYGGKAGGGKTDLLIGAAETAHRKAIIFRREYTESRDLFMRAIEIVENSGAEYKAVRTPVTEVYLPRGDRRLEFGGVKNPDDWMKHRGRARDYYGFDEATEFEEIMIRSLIGWNRTTIPGQRCRVILTFNPPSAKKGQWIKSFFAPWVKRDHPNPAKPGELRWFTTIAARDVECPNGDPFDVCKKCGATFGECDHLAESYRETVYPLSRTFIPASLDDNEYLNQPGSKYRATLMGLPEPLRSQLLNGEFDADEPDDAYQLIKLQWVLDANERWIEAMSQEHTPLEQPLSALANDPAHGGTDENVNAARIGAFIPELEAIPGREVPRGKDVILRLHQYASRFINIAGRDLSVGMDVIGVGSAPQEVAEDNGFKIIPFDGASRDGIEEERDLKTGILGFKNRRALWWWRFREALDPDSPGFQAPMLPPDRELLADLCAVHFEVTPRGIQIESKDDIRKKLGRSPGKGDATVYVWNTKAYDFGYESLGKRRDLDDIATSNHSWKTNGFR